MKWHQLDEGLPSEKSLVWVYIEGKGVILRLYDNDSFGLGDDDFNVLVWQEFSCPHKPDLKNLCQNQLYTSQEQDRINVDSLILYQNLAS